MRDTPFADSQLIAADYYANIDTSATGDAFKAQLKALVSVKTVISYDGVWNSFAAVDKFLPGYPCSTDLNMIPDIYSNYCWTPQ